MTDTCVYCGAPNQDTRRGACDDCSAEKPFAAEPPVPTHLRAVIAELLDGLPDWHRDAACIGVDPELFFPERGASTADAKRVCRGCPVREECLLYAIEQPEKFGIWGGRSERERRRIRRAMNKKGAA